MYITGNLLVVVIFLNQAQSGLFVIAQFVKSDPLWQAEQFLAVSLRTREYFAQHTLFPSLTLFPISCLIPSQRFPLFFPQHCVCPPDIAIDSLLHLHYNRKTKQLFLMLQFHLFMFQFSKFLLNFSPGSCGDFHTENAHQKIVQLEC